MPNWDHIKNVPSVSLNPEFFEDARFEPTVYIYVDIRSNLKVHFMTKNNLDSSGIMERITVIESRGLEVFENVLPKEVADIAQQIISGEPSIFDELKSKYTFKYREMVQSFVSCNNYGCDPKASNLIRALYDDPQIPDVLPKYQL